MDQNRHLPRQPFTAAELRAVVAYDPETGKFSRVKDGKPIGFVAQAKGYECLHVLGKKCNAHRLAWLYVHGEWPVGEVDHINGVKTDNRIDNLRDVPRSINSQNQNRAHCRSGTGLLGVAVDKARGKWVASIFHSGRKWSLGRFDSPEAAHQRYVQEKRLVHPGCTI